MINCKNCGTEMTSKFCPNCGQPAVLKRIDAHYVAHEIEHVLHFERGILYTIRELLTAPGLNVRNYISENRSRLVKPIIFVIVTSLLYSIISHFFHTEERYMQSIDTHSIEKKLIITTKIFQWLQSHYGYANIIMGFFIALWTKVFFKKYDYNLFEILILLCFVMGMTMLIYALFAIMEGITHISLIMHATVLTLVYYSWAIGQFFDKSKLINYFKAFMVLILGFITYSIVILCIGITLDILAK
ncbi:DUF3667 domain-containing protein [Sphingobacterium sp.]|uniref:DUF3667 domain-containing protein n=1 Tax=Sphingobacterium sp. TaxID=341027 RepID=UPI002FDC97F4